MLGWFCYQIRTNSIISSGQGSARQESLKRREELVGRNTERAGVRLLLTNSLLFCFVLPSCRQPIQRNHLLILWSVISFSLNGDSKANSSFRCAVLYCGFSTVVTEQCHSFSQRCHLKKKSQSSRRKRQFCRISSKRIRKHVLNYQVLLTEHSKLVKVGLSKSDFDDSGSLCWHNGRALLHKQKHFCPQAIYSRLVTYSLRHSAASALASSLRDLALTVLLW